MEKHMLAILLNCFFISDATAGSNLRQNAIHMNNPWRFSINAPAARGRAEAPADFSRSASPLLKFTLRSSKPEIECLSDPRASTRTIFIRFTFHTISNVCYHRVARNFNNLPNRCCKSLVDPTRGFLFQRRQLEPKWYQG